MACMLAGNVAMRSGGAHCLKHGVTSNTLLGLRIATIEDDLLEIGGAHLAAAGYDWLGLLCVPEGQLGVVAEVTVRILRSAAGARAMVVGFPSVAAAALAVADVAGPGIIPVALEFMDRPCTHACEAFAQAGYPLDAEALLIVEVEGSAREQEVLLERLVGVCRPHGPTTVRVARTAEESAVVRKGRKGHKGAFGAVGRIGSVLTTSAWTGRSRLAPCRRRRPGSPLCRRSAAWRSPTCPTPATATSSR